MSLRTTILALFFGLTLLPLGWNKVDVASHGTMIYGLGVVLVLLLILTWKELSGEGFGGRTKNIMYGAGILLALCFAISFAKSPIQNFGWSEVMVMVGGLGIFFLVSLWKKEEQRKLLFVFLGLGLLASLLGLAQYLYRGESRIAGPFYAMQYISNYWPNAFATFLLTVWPLALLLQKKYLRLAAITVLLSALILTFSRAAFLVLIGQIVILTYINRTKIRAIFTHKTVLEKLKNPLFKSIAIALAATLILTFAFQAVRPLINSHQTNSFIQKATFAGTEQQTSFQERFDFMNGAIRLMKTHPLTGSGPFSFRFIYPTIQKDFLAIADHPHNWYLKIGLEEGIPALLLFLTFLSVIVYSNKKILLSATVFETHTTPQRSEGADFDPVFIKIIIFIALLGPLAHALADFNMNFLSNQILFWTLLASFASTADAKKLLKKPHQSHPTVFATLVAIMICATVVSIASEAYFSATKQFTRMHYSRNYFLEMSGDALGKNDSAGAENYIQSYIKQNPYDAAGWHQYGKILETEHDNRLNEDTLYAYQKAVQLDPANDFRYYLDYFRFANALNLAETATYQDFKTKAFTFLIAYPAKVKTNIHFTAQSSNAPDAISLARLLNDIPLSLRIKRALRSFQL